MFALKLMRLHWVPCMQASMHEGIFAKHLHTKEHMLYVHTHASQFVPIFICAPLCYQRAFRDYIPIGQLSCQLS